MSKVQKRKLSKINKILLVIAGVFTLTLLAFTFIAGRFLSIEYLEEAIEKELRCEAKLESVQRRLFSLGGSGLVKLGKLEIRLQDSAIQELLDESKLNETERELAQKILSEPVFLAESGQLRFRRLPLLRGKLEVESLNIERPEIFIHEIKGVGTNLEGLEKQDEDELQGAQDGANGSNSAQAGNGKQSLEAQANEQQNDEEKAKNENKSEKKLSLDLNQFTLSGGYFEYTTTDPRDKEAKKESISYSARDIQLTIKDFSEITTQASNVPLELSAKLAIDRGGAKERLAQLELVGQGELYWKEGVERELDTMESKFTLQVGEESFINAQELSTELSSEISQYMAFLNFSATKWKIPPVLEFIGLREVQISGKGKTLILENEPQLSGKGEILGVDTQNLMLDTIITLKKASWVSLAKDGQHKITLLAQAPKKVSQRAWKVFPHLLKELNSESQWPALRDAYFRNEELVMRFVSEGSTDDIDFKTRPKIQDVISLEKVGLGILLRLLEEGMEQNQ